MSLDTSALLRNAARIIAVVAWFGLLIAAFKYFPHYQGLAALVWLWIETSFSHKNYRFSSRKPFLLAALDGAFIGVTGGMSKLFVMKRRYITPPSGDVLEETAQDASDHIPLPYLMGEAVGVVAALGVANWAPHLA